MYMELENVIEELANNDKPFMLAIMKTTYSINGGDGKHTIRPPRTEVLNIFDDKDEVVSKLFDLVELYGWQI